MKIPDPENIVSIFMNDPELINQLKQAATGLLWLSESDYPFEIVCLENVTDIQSKLLKLTDSNPNTQVEVRELDRFFQEVTEAQDWYEEEEIAECQRYQELVSILKTHLTDIKVYCLGETEINVYILGRTVSGSVVGLSTISVET